jgi:catechol 2,3-dioxygenase-like lactoylglutathione lyase family enzyme
MPRAVCFDHDIGPTMAPTSRRRRIVMLQDSQVFASIPAADLARARGWYEEKLGLTPSQEMPGGHIYMCGEGTAFLLYETSFAGTGQHTIAGWRVGDLAKEMAELRNRSVTFEDYDLPGLKTTDGVATMDGMSTAWFKDCEGNTLNVSQM